MHSSSAAVDSSGVGYSTAWRASFPSTAADGDLRPSYVDADEAGHSAAFWYKSQQMDRRLAYKNMRTALIAGAISLIIFALSFVSGLVYT